MYIIASYYKSTNGTVLANQGMAYWMAPSISRVYTHMSYTAMNNCRNVTRYYVCNGSIIQAQAADLNWGNGSHETNNGYNTPGYIYGFNA